MAFIRYPKTVIDTSLIEAERQVLAAVLEKKDAEIAELKRLLSNNKQ